MSSKTAAELTGIIRNIPSNMRSQLPTESFDHLSPAEMRGLLPLLRDSDDVEMETRQSWEAGALLPSPLTRGAMSKVL